MPPTTSRSHGPAHVYFLHAAIDWARAHGFERVSLNFAPFAALLAPEADLTAMQDMQRRAQRRDLPRVGIAALAAEAYLPFGGDHR